MLRVRIFGFWILTYFLVMLFLLVPHTLAQSGSERDVTLKDLGYEDTRIKGPNAEVRFPFELPMGWEIVNGSYFILDFDYEINFVDVATSTLPASIDVRLNGQVLETRSVITPTTQKLRIDLPAEQFRLAFNDTRPNILEIRLRGGDECGGSVENVFVIKETSLLHLVYQERPLEPDLARFPSPIYQRYSIEPNSVRFILPDEFDETDVRAASIIAARLGQLTSHRLPISLTLASNQLSTPLSDEHVIVIGQPDENAVIAELDLPVSLTERQLVLSSQMPQTVTPGAVMSYTLLVENSTNQAQSVFVEDSFSAFGHLLSCGSGCKQIVPGRIRWDVGSLGAQQAVSTTVVLQLAPVITPSTSIKHTANLFDSAGKVLNVDTLAAQIGQETSESLIFSSEQRSPGFFVQGEQALAEDAGVLQEIVSPWNPQRVAVVVTGLTDEALLKAAHGLNPDNRFPGIWGEAVVVQEMQPITPTEMIAPRDVTFASLGYENEELIVIDLAAAQYFFDFPPGLALREDAYLSLHLAHSPSVSTVGGGIKVSLNGVAVGSAMLDDSNLNDAWLRFPLNQTAVQPGQNRLRIETTVNLVDPCVVKENYWLSIYDDSFLYLSSQPARTRFDLDNFPYPFNEPGDLTNVIFALPEKPAVTELEGLLRVASLLGNSSNSKEFMPTVTLGEASDSPSLKNSHILAVGLPTQNPIIQAANDQLPQPFLPNSNEIFQRIDKPTYSIPPGTDLGYVQTLISPWTEGENLELALATGTTDVGVSWALSALAQPSSELRGDLVLVRNDRISSTDTRPPLAGEVLTDTTSITATMPLTSASMDVTTPVETPISLQASADGGDISADNLPAPTATALPAVEVIDQPAVAPAPTRPVWLLPLVIVSVLSTVVLILIWFRKAN